MKKHLFLLFLVSVVIIIQSAIGQNSSTKTAGDSKTACENCITSISTFEGSSLTWAACADACFNLEESGFSDWRMPSFDEIVYYRTAFAPPDGSWINQNVWTSTLWTAQVGSWIVLYESAGSWNNVNYSTKNSCRCVR